MAQHRTKQDKIATQMRREEKYQYNLQEMGVTADKIEKNVMISTTTSPKSKLSGSLNTKHLNADLFRSFISTVVICVTLLTIWYLI